MKATLKPVKAWLPHKDEDTEEWEQAKLSDSMRIYVGSLHVANVIPVTTEPEELFKIEPSRILREIDWNDILELTSVKRQGVSLQKILDDIEEVFKHFLNKICK